MSDGNAEAVELDVARARAGDRSALESVVRAIQKEVYQLALRFLGHPQDAEDATQEESNCAAQDALIRAAASTQPLGIQIGRQGG